MSITFETSDTSTGIRISGVNASSQQVEIVPGSEIREGEVTLAGGVVDYGLTVQVRPATSAPEPSR